MSIRPLAVAEGRECFARARPYATASSHGIGRSPRPTSSRNARWSARDRAGDASADNAIVDADDGKHLTDARRDEDLVGLVKGLAA